MLRYADIGAVPPNGWTQEHIAILEEELQQAKQNGESLRPAFERAAQRTGRKPNSIRNYYYTTYRTARRERTGRTFEVFTPRQVHDLLVFMLKAQAQGKSVRRAAMELGEFDHSTMLRCQNKYRSLIKTRPELVQRVIEELRAQGECVFDPYADTVSPQEFAAADEKQVEKVLEQIWNDLYTHLRQLSSKCAMRFAQGITMLLDVSQDRAGYRELVGHNLALKEENERLRRENTGLIRQLEMICMPIDGDVSAQSGIGTARRAAQRPELFQNTAQELAVFVPKNDENTK